MPPATPGTIFITVSCRLEFEPTSVCVADQTQNSPNPFNISEQCQPLPDVKYTRLQNRLHIYWGHNSPTTLQWSRSPHTCLYLVESAYHFKDAVLKLYYFMPQRFVLEILGTIQSYSGLDLFKVQGVSILKCILFYCQNKAPYLLAYKPPLCGPCKTNALSLGGLLEKRIYSGDGLCAIQILLGRVSDPPLEGGPICQFTRYSWPGACSTRG